MNPTATLRWIIVAVLFSTCLHSQDPDRRPPRDGSRPAGRPAPAGPGRPRGELKLVARFDKDGDKRLDRAERTAAREHLQAERAAGRGRRGFGGGGRAGFGPGLMLAPPLVAQGDTDKDDKLSSAELVRVLNAWFERLDTRKTGKLTAEEFLEGLPSVALPPAASRPQRAEAAPAARGGVNRAFGPAQGLFTAADADKDGTLTAGELTGTFSRWFGDWDAAGTGSLAELQIRQGLDAVLPRSAFPGAVVGRGPGRRGTPTPGARVSPADVKPQPEAPLYDPHTLRTFFLEFEGDDWEKELADFNNTDVEVPAQVTVDGKIYPGVGVHFRGMSSFSSVGEGWKRSLNLSFDFVDKGQSIGGYRALNFLNSHSDPTFLHSVLFYEIARDYLPAPKANLVKVVINGESWGVYVNVQQFNKDFARDWFDRGEGVRWKVPGSPGGRGSLAYLGEDVEEYKRIYEIKSKDEPRPWADFIRLCKVLNETPPERLEEAIAPLLDIDGALKFLALDIALINNDGYWIRSSDYFIYQDAGGRFHILPHDANETFSTPGGLDPLFIAEDSRKPLASRLLAVPALRQRYLGHVRDIAQRWLDWEKLGPIAAAYHRLIAEEVKADTRKLEPTEAFERSLTGGSDGSSSGRPSLKGFAEKRRQYLLRVTSARKTARI